MRKSRLMLLLSLSAGAAPGLAQQVPVDRPPPPAIPPPGPGDDGNDGADGDTIVRGARLPGSVIGDIPPEQQLTPADIQAYGVSSIGDLLAELAPQTRSGRGSGGAPVVLLNGLRISGFREIRDLPTEAILRVDILPEEVALKYGYRADQRVVNFVLRPRFRSIAAELETALATAGGIASPKGELDIVRIGRQRRISLHFEYEGRESVTEADRGIRFDPSPFAIGGNVAGRGGGEIDPALSALAGRPVTVAGLPASAAAGAPSLADFVATSASPAITDPTPFRTLSPSQRTFSANGTYQTTIFGNVSASVNAELGTDSTTGYFGLPTLQLTVPAGNPFSPFATDVLIDRAISDGLRPLTQRSLTVSGHFGTTLSGTVAGWQWTLTGSYDRADNETFTDTGLSAVPFQVRIAASDPGANPFAPLGTDSYLTQGANRAYSSNNRGQIDATASGSLFTLPGGDVTSTLKLGGDFTDLSTSSARAGIAQSSNVMRNIADGQVNIDVPITSRRKGFLAALGNLSANFNIAYDSLSDFDSLRTIGYGFNWSPIEAVQLIGSITEQDEAPSPQQLGNPIITTPNVVVFDYVRAENALVSIVTGGNPGLRRDNRLARRLGLTLKPFDKPDLTFTASFVDARVDGAIASFPSATAEIEAAFPDRFTRGADGRLLRIDSRPINYAQTSRSELRLGINFSQPLKSKLQKQIEAFRAGTGPNPFAGLTPPGRGPFGQGGQRGGPEGGRQQGGAGGPPGGGPGGAPGGGFGGRGGFGGPGGGFGGRGGPGGGRLQFALYDTIHFIDRVQIGAAGPTLDLLGGDTIGNNGGQPRHEFEAQAGYSNDGIGVRLSADWRSGTRVLAGTGANPQTLDFGSIGTVNLRLFANFGQRLDLVRKHPWLRGTRFVISVDNLFDQRQRVTDANGLVPITYQPAYRDPLGRSVRLSIRKLFF